MIQDSLTISQEEEGEGRKEGPHRKELWHWSWLCALQALEMEHHGRWDRKQNRVRKLKVRSEISWWCNQQQLLIGRQVILPDRDTAWVFDFISLHLWGVRVWLLLQFYLWCHFLPPLLCWSQTGIPPVSLDTFARSHFNSPHDDIYNEWARLQTTSEPRRHKTWHLTGSAAQQLVMWHTADDCHTNESVPGTHRKLFLWSYTRDPL